MTTLKAYSKLLIVIMIFITFASVAYVYWQHNKRFPETDDAYVQANLVNIAAQVNGPVVSTDIKDHEYVHKDETLFQIDPQPFQIAVNQAQAQLILAKQKVGSEEAAVEAARATLAQAQAKYLDAQQNAHRILTLVKTGRVSKSDGDQTIEELNVSKAQVSAAENQLQQALSTLGLPGDQNAEIQSAYAALAKAQLDLQHTTIVAPSNGYINNFKIRTGTMINAGQDLFSLIEDKEWWVDANFKETQLRRIRPGQTAIILVDSYPGHPFKGYVQSISDGSGAAFSLLPPENATGNWIKVTQRIPVKIVFINPEPNYPLRVGESADVTIDTTNLTADASRPGIFSRITDTQ